LKCAYLIPTKAPLPEEVIFNQNKATVLRRHATKNARSPSAIKMQNRIKRRKAGERGVSSDEDPSPEPSWSGDVPSVEVDWSNMSGSSSSSPPRATPFGRRLGASPSDRGRDVMTSTAPEPSPAAGAVSVEDVINLVACQYVDFPGIGTIDLDALELPGNDQEMLEVATERMFVEPSILETIASVTSALRQYDGASGSATSATPEAAERVLEESAAGAESAAVVSAPSPTREDHGASLP
jgi:hypothetical protein